MVSKHDQLPTPVCHSGFSDQWINCQWWDDEIWLWNLTQPRQFKLHDMIRQSQCEVKEDWWRIVPMSGCEHIDIAFATVVSWSIMIVLTANSRRSCKWADGTQSQSTPANTHAYTGILKDELVKVRFFSRPQFNINWFKTSCSHLE